MKKYLTGLFIIFSFIGYYGCADQIVTECDDPVNTNSSLKLNAFSGIQTKVFNQSCALAGCHGNNATQANLLLTEGEAYSNLVNVQGSVYSQFIRVIPGDSENSLLIKQLKGELSQMPPSGKLNDAVIDSIALWIDNGALNN